MWILKKSAANQDIIIGPFLDATDGVTAEVGLATALGGTGAGGVKVAKSGSFASRNDATAVTHDATQSGWYKVRLNATDTSVAGNLVVSVHDAATHLPVWHQFRVVEALTYDAIFSNVTTNLAFNANGRVDVGEWLGAAVTGATAGVPDVNALRINSDAVAAASLALSALGIVGGSFIGTPNTTQQGTDLSPPTSIADFYKGSLLVITSGVAAGERVGVIGWAITGSILTTDPLATAPAASDTFVIV